MKKAKNKAPRSARPEPVDTVEQLAAARRAFRHESFNESTMAERVRLASFYAKEIVLRGVDVSHVADLKSPAADQSIGGYVERLTGLRADDGEGNEVTCLEAAFAIGVAVGLSLRPELFTVGGA